MLRRGCCRSTRTSRRTVSPRNPEMKQPGPSWLRPPPAGCGCLWGRRWRWCSVSTPPQMMGRDKRICRSIFIGRNLEVYRHVCTKHAFLKATRLLFLTFHCAQTTKLCFDSLNKEQFPCFPPVCDIECDSPEKYRKTWMGKVSPSPIFSLFFSNVYITRNHALILLGKVYHRSRKSWEGLMIKRMGRASCRSKALERSQLDRFLWGTLCTNKAKAVTVAPKIQHL